MVFQYHQYAVHFKNLVPERELEWEQSEQRRGTDHKKMLFRNDPFSFDHCS